MQQRYYDPGIGRFLSVDPVTTLSDPVNYFGRYHYANNNPYRFTDPDGRMPGETNRDGFRDGKPDRNSYECRFNPSCRYALADSKATAKPTFVQKVVRNAKWFGKAFKLEGQLGFTAGARVKLGPAKATFEAGSMSPFGLKLNAGSSGVFTEVRGPGANIEVGPVAAGWVGSSERSYYGGRYAEERSEGHLASGLHKGSATDAGEVGLGAGLLILDVSATVDIGNVAVSLFYWGDFSEDP